MKRTKNTLAVFAIAMLLTACGTHRPAVPSGPAYGHEKEFRKQIEDHRGLKSWDYKVRDITFSDDYEKALVMFSVFRSPDASPEVILEHRGFGRYVGTLYGTRSGAPEEGVADTTTFIRVVVPLK